MVSQQDLQKHSKSLFSPSPDSPPSLFLYACVRALALALLCNHSSICLLPLVCFHNASLFLSLSSPPVRLLPSVCLSLSLSLKVKCCLFCLWFCFDLLTFHTLPYYRGLSAFCSQKTRGNHVRSRDANDYDIRYMYRVLSSGSRILQFYQLDQRTVQKLTRLKICIMSTKYKENAIWSRHTCKQTHTLISLMKTHLQNYIVCNLLICSTWVADE